MFVSWVALKTTHEAKKSRFIKKQTGNEVFSEFGLLFYMAITLGIKFGGMENEFTYA